MVYLSPDGRGVPARQTNLALEGVEFSADVSPAHRLPHLRPCVPSGVHGRLSRASVVVHGGWLERQDRPSPDVVRVHRQPRHGPELPGPPWGRHPKAGSILKAECRTLVNVLKKSTSTPEDYWFCLREGFGNLEENLYRRASRVQATGRSCLLFHDPIDPVISCTTGRETPFWGDSPNIWWPEGRAWCIATDIDLVDTYIAGSQSASRPSYPAQTWKRCQPSAPLPLAWTRTPSTPRDFRPNSSLNRKAWRDRRHFPTRSVFRVAKPRLPV